MKTKRSIIIRIIFIIILLGILAICVGGILISIKPKKGFQIIESDYSTIQSLGSEYKFYYYLDDSNGNSLETNRKSYTTLYSNSLDKAYKLFDSYTFYEDIQNIYYINNHINQDIEIDSLLYDSIQVLYNLDKRILLSGLITEYWDGLLYSINYQEKINLDPINNPLMQARLLKLLDIMNHIDIIFKENNTINLKVNLEYIESIGLEDASHFIDFSIYKDAFIMQYVKDCFNEQEYYEGYMLSVEGYALDFGGKKNSTTIQLLDKDSGIKEVSNIKYESGYAYVAFYGFNVYETYPYYIIESDEIVRRGKLIDYTTGYSLMNYDSILGYNQLPMYMVVYYTYQLAFKDIDYNLWYSIIDNNKIYTNISDFKSNYTSYEVIYD